MARIELETGDIVEVEESFFDLPSGEQQRQVNQMAFNLEREKSKEAPATELQGMEKAINIASKVAPYAGMAFRTTPMGMLGAAGLTGGSRFVEGVTEGESKLEALKNAAIAAGIDLGTFGLGKGLGKVIRTGPVSNVLGQTGEMLSSVPQKSITKAIQDPSILNKTEDFKDVGLSAQKAMSDLMEEVGRQGKFQKRLLRGSDIKTDLGVYVDRQKKLLTRKEGSQPVYNAKEKKEINTYLNKIKKEDDPAGLNQIIKRIDEITNYNYKDKRPKVVESKLKEIRKKLSTTLKRKVDGYDASRAEQQNILGNVKSAIGRKLDKDPSALFKRKQSEPVQEGLEELDRLVPNARLLDRTQNIQAQDQFSKIYPGQGGGSGSAQGLANLARIALGTLAPVLTPLFSPIGQREIIKQSPKGMQALGKLLAGSAGFTPLQPEPDGSITKDTVLRNRGGN